MYIVKGKFGHSTWAETQRDSRVGCMATVKRLKADGAIKVKVLSKGLIIYLWDIQKGRVV